MDNYETGIYTDNPDDTLRYMKSTEAVALVLCKDCVHKCVCPMYGGSQFFCAYGEREEDG